MNGSRPRKILLLHGAAATYMGGAEYLTLGILRRLPRERYQLLAAVKPGGLFAQALDELGISQIDLPVQGVCPTRTRRLVMLAFLLTNVYAAFVVARVVRQKAIDLVYTISRGALVAGSLAGFLTGVPVIVHLHDMPRRIGLYATFAYLGAHRIIAPSAASRASLVSIKGLGHIIARRTSVVYSGIDLNRLVLSRDAHLVRQELGLSDSDFVIGTIGRIEQTKGQAEILKAAPAVIARFPQVRFVFVGDAQSDEDAFYRQSLEGLIEYHSLQQYVKFTGFRTDVPDLLNAFDLVVSASWSETFGLALAEAMALGKPTIATDIGSMRELVVHGETGLLVPLHDVQALSAAIIELVADRQRITAMGNAGRQRVLSHFTIDVCAQAIESVFRAALPSLPQQRR